MAIVGRGETPAPSQDDTPTFTRDVAPILFARCVVCHRPEGSAPFSLLEFEDARRHARQIATATRKRLMPPWLPVEGFGEFADARRLNDEQIATLARWAESGAAEGDPAALPPRPTFPDGWLLGAPDLVVAMETSVVVAAEGRDQLRNFVLPIDVKSPRWVRAIELRFDPPRVVHHATLQVDETSGCRQLDARDPEPGFGGMGMGSSRQAGGHFVSWTPGKQPETFYEGTAWRLVPGSDFVLQLHLVPTGKPELLRASIGLHYTDDPPTRPVYSLVLRADAIDIPPGQRDYAVDERFTLPVDALAARIYPHAHYLGRRMTIDALRPDGGSTPLLRIDEWNFDWQESYLYARPVELPRGATIAMHYEYDNSDANPRNPSRPPVRVKLGNQSSDEMGAFTLELLLASDADRRAVIEAFERRSVARHPEDFAAHYNLALVLAELGRLEEAQAEYGEVLRLEPSYLPAGNNLANLLVRQRRLAEAIELYGRMLAIEPRSAVTLLNLGATLVDSGQVEPGIARLEQAIALQPERIDARLALALAHEKLERFDLAFAEYEKAYAVDPASPGALEGLTRGCAARGDLDSAERWARLAVAASPREPDVHRRLAFLLARAGKLDASIEAWRATLAIAPDDLVALLTLSRLLAVHPEPAKRRPQESVELAERAATDPRADPLQLAEGKATAYAAAGRLPDAAKELEQALGLLAAAERGERADALDPRRRSALAAELSRRLQEIRAALEPRGGAK